MRGASHPQYRHGQETLEAKAERNRMLTELRELEAISYALGLARGAKWRGRKPTNFDGKFSSFVSFLDS